MNIGIDLHNTLDKFPNMFYYIISSYIQSGHNVYIISGPRASDIHKELHTMKFTDIVTDVYSIIDFLQNELCIEGWYNINSKGEKTWYCDDVHWWSSKALICEKYNIDILIDDRIEYRQYFTRSHKTRFILFNDNLTESIRNIHNICPINLLCFN